jgi:hypothetical protein
MHTITEVYFLYLQGSSRKAHSLDYPDAECSKLLQNSHTYISNYTALYPRKLKLCINLMASELILGSIKRTLGFMCKDITFSCTLLHKESKSPKKNSNKAIQEQPKLVDAYVASFENSILHPGNQCMHWSAQRCLLHFLHVTCWYE